MMEVYAHVRYDERVTPERKKKIIRGMKFRMYLRFPALLFKRVKWTIKDVAPTPLEYGVLMVKAVGI